MKNYFTFGFGQNHCGRFVCIEGGFEEAREKMFKVFGSAWSMQYDENGWFCEDGVSQEERFNLKELKI